MDTEQSTAVVETWYLMRVLGIHSARGQAVEILRCLVESYKLVHPRTHVFACPLLEASC